MVAAIPTLLGFVTGEKQVKVWCPYCEEYHIHGYTPQKDAQNMGHRVAHCDPNSPLWKTGYHIRLVDDETLFEHHMKSEGKTKEFSTKAEEMAVRLNRALDPSMKPSGKGKGAKLIERQLNDLAENGHHLKGWVDHPTYDGDTFISEPYSFGEDAARNLLTFCDLKGLTFTVRGDSWHFPGRTLRVSVTKKAAP